MTFWELLLAPSGLHKLPSGPTVSISSQATEGKASLVADATINHFGNLALGLHFLVSKGYTFFEARVKNVSAITARILEVGFNDALAPAAGLAFSNHTTPTAVSTNAAIFGYASTEMHCGRSTRLRLAQPLKL